jgi:hypothetical protein
VLIQIDVEVEYGVGDIGIVHRIVRSFNIELLESVMVRIPWHRTCIMQWWLSLLLAFSLQNNRTSPLMT